MKHLMLYRLASNACGGITCGVSYIQKVGLKCQHFADFVDILLIL
jgi:hypothetical protein